MEKVLRRTIAEHELPALTVAEVQRGMPPLPDSYCNLVFEALSDAGLPS